MCYFQKKKKEGKYGVGTNLMHPFFDTPPYVSFQSASAASACDRELKKGGGGKGLSLSIEVSRLINRKTNESPSPPFGRTIQRERFFTKVHMIIIIVL